LTTLMVGGLLLMFLLLFLRNALQDIIFYAFLCYHLALFSFSVCLKKQKKTKKNKKKQTFLHKTDSWVSTTSYCFNKDLFQ